MATEMKSLIEETGFMAPTRSQVGAVISDMVAFVTELVVDNEGAYRKVTSLYKQAREWKKAIEAKRKELVEPFRSRVAEINDRAKELTDPLDRVVEQSNAKVAGYHKLLEERKKAEDEKIRAEAALFDAAEELYIPDSPKTIRGDGAISVTRTEKRFKVMDLAKVPTKYLMVDEKALMQDIKLGITDIPGIEIYEETTTQLRVR